ncbi:MAG: Outer membrane protein TolC precursor [bacterium ADurb.Bin374]|nr:MAG: Outer membrane protein TolC precursor [bacterium ADurb.Bin374]
MSDRFLPVVVIRFLFVLLGGLSTVGTAPADSFVASLTSVASGAATISFGEYLDAIEHLSPELECQRQGVTAAKAGISVARIRPDPQLTGGIDSLELASANKPNASIVTVCELEIPFETAGKREKRIKAARTGVRQAEVEVKTLRWRLISDAAEAFIEAARLQGVLERKRSSLKAYQELVSSNEIRCKAGDIGELELRQSRMEEERFQTEVGMAEAEAGKAVVNLSKPLGKGFAEVFPGREIDARLAFQPSDIPAEEWISRALKGNEELRRAELAVDAARDALRLARANRSVDPTVNIGLTNTPRVGERFDAFGTVTNSPAERSLTMGLTVGVPLPLSNRERGPLKQAEVAVKQAELQLQSLTEGIKTEVQGSYTQYQAMIRAVEQYRQRILGEADRVLEGIRKSYRMGEASLHELLEAQRSADDIYQEYLQAMADYALARVKLLILAGEPVAL